MPLTIDEAFQPEGLNAAPVRRKAGARPQLHGDALGQGTAVVTQARCGGGARRRSWSEVMRLPNRSRLRDRRRRWGLRQRHRTLRAAVWPYGRSGPSTAEPRQDEGVLAGLSASRIAEGLTSPSRL